MIYNRLIKAKQEQHKQLAVLIDPDKVTETHLSHLLHHAIQAGVDYFFVGGSLVMDANATRWIKHIKQRCNIPVIIFPGSPMQINPHADAIFFLSLISGRNPELLIGHHVLAAPLLKQMDIEVMPTGYLLIDGGAPTTVSYISNSQPIPNNKPQIALCTALAGEMLGMKVIYLDSGSGAKLPVSETMIKTVSKNIDIPLIVGGGIRTPERAYKTCAAGADLIVVGNAFEKQPELIGELCQAVHSLNISPSSLSTSS
ncbi:MAG: geranylgeranylglyceryl/heptaprenylglyceryl phosphate synthase [Chitinophagales bacterium]